MNQLEKYLMNGILSPGPFAHDRSGEQQQCRTMLPVEGLDLGNVSAVGRHVQAQW